MDYGGIAYICILNSKNQPLCLRGFGDVDALELQISAMASIDIIEEMLLSRIAKSEQGSQSASDSGDFDPYLGLVCPALSNLAMYDVYAYVGATGFKIIAIIQDTMSSKNEAIRKLFDSICRLYCKAICNPLKDSNLDTPKFISQLEEIARNF